ncbi:MAG: AI-2E family transporter [Muribaculaceae bacterium]|nr:AI-2E family transporter [Muribaculaceae bacterium]
MNNESRPYTFDRVVRLVIAVIITAAILWLINALKDVLLPFLVACLIAYMFEPFVQYNRQLLRLKGRIVAIFVTLFEAAILFGIGCYWVVPDILDEMHQMSHMFDKYKSTTLDISYFPDWLHDFIKRNIDFDLISKKLMNQNADGIVDKIMALIHGGLNVVLGIVGWLIVFLYVIFIMLDYDRLMRGFKLMVPPRFRRVTYKIGRDVKDSMNHYFRGQALISCCVSVIYCAGFAMAGLPLAVIIGLGTAVLFMIPYCQYISLIPVTILCLVDTASNGGSFWTMWWECIATFAAVQVVGDLILTPRIMGKAMGLNPAIILLSLSIWGSLLGFIGMIIALPLTTLLLSYYEQYVIMRNNNEPPAQRRKEVEEIEAMADNPFSSE